MFTLMLGGVLGALSLMRTQPPAIASAPPARTVTIDLARLRELLLQRDRPQEQSQAAILLVQNTAVEAQAIVREGLRRHDRPDVFQALASAVRLWRDERFIPSLLQALSSESPAIRSAAIDALAAQNPRVITRWLLSLAEDASAPTQARQAAVAALSRCVHKSSVTSLLKLLTSDSPSMRQAAAAALQELSGQPLPADIIQWQNWWQPYKDLADDDWLASRAALLADRSRRLGDELQRTEAALLQTHRQLFAKVPPTDRIAYFQTLAQSDFPVLRSQAVAWSSETLKDSGGTEQKALADLLLLLSRDGTENVQRQAVLALEGVDDPRAFDRLLQLLQLGTPSIRAAAARSLGRFGSSKTAISGDLKKRTVLALEQALGDTAMPVVASAAESLGALQSGASGPILVGLLKHPDEAVRHAAGLALESVASAAVLESIYLGLEDPSAQVRFALVGALGKTASRDKLDDAARGSLVRRLSQILSQDTDPGVRSRAATVLGDVGGPADLQLLWQRVRAKEDNRVQLKAWSAITEILARAQSLPLLAQWEQLLGELNENARRSQLFQELRDRWTKADAPRALLDFAAAALVRSLLSERKWVQAIPLAVEQARRASTDSERRERLRWLLVAGTQALEEKRPAETIKLLKEIEELLLDAKELGAEFAELRRKAQQMLAPGNESGAAAPSPNNRMSIREMRLLVGSAFL